MPFKISVPFALLLISLAAWPVPHAVAENKIWRIGFLDMTEVVEQTMNKITFIEKPTLEEYFDSDGEARNFAASLIQM